MSQQQDNVSSALEPENESDSKNESSQDSSGPLDGFKINQDNDKKDEASKNPMMELMELLIKLSQDIHNSTMDLGNSLLSKNKSSPEDEKANEAAASSTEVTSPTPGDSPASDSSNPAPMQPMDVAPASSNPTEMVMTGVQPDHDKAANGSNNTSSGTIDKAVEVVENNPEIVLGA